MSVTVIRSSLTMHRHRELGVQSSHSMDGPVMVYEVMFRVELNIGRMYSVDVDPLLSMEHIRGPSMIAAEVPESERVSPP